MSITLDSSGTTSTTVSTEITLATSTNSGTFQPQFRLNNYVLGDVLQLRIYAMTLSGGTLELAWEHSIGPVPPTTIALVGPAMMSDQSIRITAKQVAGTARSMDWKLMRV